jgi:hypothetical protein
VKIFHQPNRTRQEWLRHFFYQGNCLCYPSSMFRNEIFNEVLPFNCNLRQLGDFDIWIKICMKSEIYIMQENLIRFRSHTNKENVSAATMENSTRSLWEYHVILENYLEIEDVREIVGIFPEIKTLFPKKNIDKDLIPFIVCQLALSVNSPSFVHQDFALRTLYNLMQNDKIERKLKDIYNFSYSDFIKLTGKYDIFRLKELADLYYSLNKEGENNRILQKEFDKLKTKDTFKDIYLKVKKKFLGNET